LPVVAREARQVADQQRNQQHAAGNVDGKNDVLEAIEVVRLLYGLGQQEERRKRQGDAGRRYQEIECPF